MSTLPANAASVSTRVVSWNDAAEMNDCVCRLALVMPCSTGWQVAGRRSSSSIRSLICVELEPVDLLADQEGRVAGIDDLDLLQHLADDHLDVLVVDLHALQFVDLLDLVHQELRQRLDAQDPQQVVRHRVAVDDQIARLDDVALLHHDVAALGDQVLDRLEILVDRQDRAGAACSCSPCRTRSGPRSRR